MKKSERLEIIKQIVASHEIETQHELLELLEQQELHFTQATISRDMNEIGITKIPSKNGRYIYGVSNDTPLQNIDESSFFKKPIITVKQSKFPHSSFLAVDVVPGNSMLVKRLLRERYSRHIFSLISDDDSLLLLATNQESSDYLYQELLLWVS